MPGELGEDAHLDAIGLVGAAIEILREQLLAFAMLQEILIEIFEILLAHFAVAVPPHAVAGEIVDHRMLVLGRAAGVMAGLRAERAAGHDAGFAGRDRALIERRIDRFQ